jgi:type I restriction enzyme S subunit
VAALKRIQAGLKRYKASVLKAACEGRLVPQDPADEPAADMLRRLGKQPLNQEDLAPLPIGWVWTTIRDLAALEPNSITDGPFGSNLKTEHYTDTGPRVIRLQNIGDGVFYDEKAHISVDHFNKLSKHRVYSGDLVIAALGEILPRSCIIPEYVGDAIVKADCIRFKANSYLTEVKFLLYALNSDTIRRMVLKTVHGIGRPRLNQQEIKGIYIPLPPLAEQQRIVAEVERRLSLAAQVDVAVQTGLKRAARLRQAILKRAFEGKLVTNRVDDVHVSV